MKKKAMIIILFFACFVVASYMNQVKNKEVLEAVRLVGTSNENKGMEQYLDDVKATFEKYEIKEEEKTISVSCQKNGVFTDFECVSTKENNIYYMSKWDFKNNVYSLSIKDDLGNCEELFGRLLYDAHTNNYYLQNLFDDSDKVLLKDLVEKCEFEKCVIDSKLNFEHMIGGGVGGIIAATTFIAMEPIVVELGDTVIKFIKTTLDNFWNWFTGLFKKKNSTNYLVYSFSISGVTYKTQAMTTEAIRELDDDEYYLCIADKGLGCFYFTTIDVSREVAIAALSASNLIESVIGDGSKYVLSTWTRKESEARELAREASVNWGFNGEYHWHDFEDYGCSIYMRHYHPVPLGESGSPHSFYGDPAC